MTDHTEERILLAEAMGYKTCSDGLWDGGIRRNGQGPIVLLPDPYTNPADTEAVMDWLGRGEAMIHVTIHKGLSVAVYERKRNTIESDVHDDWKHAVTEVAVKVAREMKDV